MKSNRLFILLFILINFHLLRNIKYINYLYYLLIIVIYLFLLFKIFAEQKIGYKNNLFYLYYLFLLLSCYVILITFKYTEFDLAIRAVPRFSLLLLFPLLIYKYVNCEKQVTEIIYTFLIFSAIGSLTIPFQMIIGPIDWFHEPSVRGSVVRYASLFGTSTAMGVLGGISLTAALLFQFKKYYRAIIIMSILSGMIFSLQKAALLNIFLAFIIYIILVEKNLVFKLKYIIISSFFSIFILTILSLLFNTKYIDILFKITFGITIFSNDIKVYDYSVLESIIMRLYHFPIEIMREHNIFENLFGYGLAGMGNVMNIPTKMAHNNYFDILFSGGILYLLIFIIILFIIVCKLYKYKVFTYKYNYFKMNNNITVLLGISLISIINMLFFSGFLFQPNLGIMLWVIIGLVMGYYYREIDLNNLNKG